MFSSLPRRPVFEAGVQWSHAVVGLPQLMETWWSRSLASGQRSMRSPQRGRAAFWMRPSDVCRRTSWGRRPAEVLRLFQTLTGLQQPAAWLKLSLRYSFCERSSGGAGVPVRGPAPQQPGGARVAAKRSFLRYRVETPGRGPCTVGQRLQVTVASGLMTLHLCLS